MKNFEKHIDVINKQVCLKNYSNSEVYGCEGCRFEDEYGHCDEEKKKQWLLEEYQEPVKLSHDEYVILKNLPSEYKYISRDGNGWVETYEYEPTKEKYVWSNDGEGLVGDLFVFSNLFQFIKFEDEEPYNIQELVENYEKEHKDV